MDRTLAARAPAGRRGSSSRRTSAQSGVLGGAAGLASRAGGRFAGFRAALAGRRRLRIALLCALVVAPLLGGAWLWLRHSSFVAVEHVRVSGVHGAQAGAIETALTEAAKRQSTLAADPAALKAAAARYPQVAAVHVQASFPHAMRITVVERRAVAALLVGGTKIAIGSDGIALGTGAATASLPTVGDDVAPASGGRDSNPLVLQALTVLGAAPAKIDPLVARAYFSARGLTLAMKNGLLVYFGDATRPHAKWMALAAVLADESSSGAVYIDVRTPERAAEGFAPGQAPGDGRNCRQRQRSSDRQGRIDGLRARGRARCGDPRRPRPERREERRRKLRSSLVDERIGLGDRSPGSRRNDELERGRARRMTL